MRLRPLFSALACAVLGIVAAPRLTLPPSALVAAALVLIALGLMLVRRASVWGSLCLILPFFALAALRTHEATQLPPTEIAHQQGPRKVAVRGEIAGPVEATRRDGQRFLLRALTVDGAAVTGLVAVTVAPSQPTLQPSDRVTLFGRLEAPPAATNPGQFDYRRYLAHQGVHSALHSKSITREYAAPPGPITWLRAQLRERCVRRLRLDDAVLLQGLLIADRAALPAELDNAFAQTGTVHLLSTSGLHLGVLAVALRILLGRRRRGVFLTLAAIWLFAALAGAGSAITRSAVVLSVALVAPLLRRDAEPLHSLALAALVILLLQPLALYDPGTQLSFLTVAVLVAYAPLLELLWPRERGLPWYTLGLRWLALAVGVGCLAQLGSGPLVAYHFHLVSWVAPLANIPITAVGSGLVVLGLAAVVLDPVPLVGSLLWGVIAPLLTVLRELTVAFGSVPYAASSIVAPPAGLVVGYYLLLLLPVPALRAWAASRAYPSPHRP